MLNVNLLEKIQSINDVHVWVDKGVKMYMYELIKGDGFLRYSDYLHQ